MILLVRKYAYAVWNGAAFSTITGFGLDTWQWWVFTTVMVLLVAIRPTSNNVINPTAPE
jgi:hypothetical protein